MESQTKKTKRKFIVPSRSPSKESITQGPLIIEYSTSYDILYLDNLVKTKLKMEANDLPMLREEIQLIDTEMSNTRIISQLRSLEQQRTTTIAKINNISQSISEKKYISETKNIIEMFMLLDSKESNKSSVPVDAMNIIDIMQSENERTIEKLVDSYLAISAK